VVPPHLPGFPSEKQRSAYEDSLRAAGADRFASPPLRIQPAKPAQVAGRRLLIQRSHRATPILSAAALSTSWPPAVTAQHRSSMPDADAFQRGSMLGWPSGMEADHWDIQHWLPP